MPVSLLRNLYYSLIHPYYLYCLPVFGATYHNHLDALRLLQKRAIRVICNAGFLDHTQPLFFNKSILKIDDLYKHSLGCYLYSNQDLLASYVYSHNYPTRNRDQFLAPIPRLRSTEQSVIYNAINIWNDIPDDIKACTTKQNFKYHYKKHLLSQHSP